MIKTILNLLEEGDTSEETGEEVDPGHHLDAGDLVLPEHGSLEDRILGRLGNGRMVGHHNVLLVESPGPRSQSTMEWMRSSGQICV